MTKFDILILLLALSAWTVYTQISNCIAIANDMQDTAILMSEKADEIEKFKQKDVDPLLANVKTQVIQHFSTNVSFINFNCIYPVSWQSVNNPSNWFQIRNCEKAARKKIVYFPRILNRCGLKLKIW